MSVTKDTGRALYTARQQPLGEARLRQVLRIYREDLSDYPLSEGEVSVAPEAVQQAHAVWLGTASSCEAALHEMEARVAKQEEARKAGILKAAQDFMAGRGLKPPALAAAGGERYAVLEEAIGTAHEALVGAIEKGWPRWRRTLVARVPEDMEAARRAWEEAKAAIERAHHTHRAVLGLDRGVLTHNRSLDDQCAQERYRGLAGWRRYVTLGPTRINQDAYEVIDVGLASERHRELEAWLPPGDPRREELLAQEPDTSRWWIRRAAWETEHLPRECVNCGGDLSRLDAADLVWEGGRFRWKHRSARDCARARDLARVRPRAATF